MDRSRYPKLFKSLGVASMALSMSLCVTSSYAQDPINVGMSTALSGPAQALGEGMRLGVETYFKKINAEGGIDGRSLHLIVYNDSYEPKKTVNKMYRLIDKDNVIAVMGNVGTPTAVVSVPIVTKKKTLLFGAFTGASLLRTKPTNRYVINFRASYAQETGATVKGLLNAGIKPSEIAFFTQNDSYGDNGYEGAVTALENSGYKKARNLPHGRYERNTLNVEEGLSEILQSDNDPKAVIIVGAYAPVSQFIKLAKEDFPNAKFINVSFVGSTALTKALGEKGNNVVITQVVPHFLSSLEAVKEYRRALVMYGNNTQPSFVSLEGYLSAKLFVKALKQAAVNNELNREGLISAFESLKNVDVGIEIPITIDKENHQALGRVWPTKIKKRKVIPMDWSEFKKEQL